MKMHMAGPGQSAIRITRAVEGIRERAMLGLILFIHPCGHR